MGYFTARERNALGKSVDERAPTKPRESARDDFAPRRRPMNPDISSLVAQVSDGSVREIDAVIAELQHRREAILEESMRMHREIVAYAKLNRSTMESTRVISESLANLVQLPNAPAMSELIDAVSDQGDRTGASETSAESDGSFELADASRLPETRAGVPMSQKREMPTD
jgi:hypothetical protein